MGTTTLAGLMQHWPLTVDRIIDHAATAFPAREVVSRMADGRIDRRGYAAVRADAARISNALIAHGIVGGDRVATLAMNGPEHLAAWYGICGIGAVCHTLNPRLSDDQLRYIVNHAGDRLVLADGAFAPILARVLPDCPGVERVVFLSPPAEMIAHGVTLDDFLAGHGSDAVWGGFDEETAAGLCYTSGTTGQPKGVLYSHRSNFLHTLLSIQPDQFGLSSREVVLAVVPMFHANAWGLAFSAPFVGAKLVLPGAKLDAPSLCELILAEGVTCAAGVPTVWAALIDHMRTTGTRLPTLKRVVIGGSAMPERMLREFHDLGIEAIHAWGMTELSPLGTVATPDADIVALPFEAQLPWRMKQGRAPCGVEMRIVDEGGRVLPRDGRSTGAIRVRGPFVARRYYREAADVLDAEGFFDTGDIGTIDAQGFLKITDRAKDVIKSGGEWISSIDIEDAATGHAGVALAAVIGQPHAKWGERPLLLVQRREGAALNEAELRAHLATRLPGWWLPEEIRFVDSLPLGATGKIDKKAIRAQFA